MNEIIHKDEYGNEIELCFNGLVRLRLAAKGKRWLNIGYFKNGIYYKTTEHIMRKLQSFGFCHKAIQVLNPHIIKVMYDLCIYSITREDFEKHKTFLNYKEQGYELQCFVRLDKFTEYKQGQDGRDNT